MDNNISVDELSALLRDSSNIAILTHKKPDGDALASALAVFWYLIDTGKKSSNIDIVIPYYLDDFSFIPGITNVKKIPTKESYDLVVVVDCAKLNMVNGNNYLNRAKTVICFDHHESSYIPCTYHVINPSSVSCTCILYEFLKCRTKNFINCIAIGLVADTALLTTKLPTDAQDILLDLIVHKADIATTLDNLEANDRTKELARIAISRGKIRTDNGKSVYFTYLLQSDLLNFEKSLDKVNHKSIIYEIQQNTQIDFDSIIFVMQKETNEYKVSLRTNIPTLNLAWICSNLVSSGKLINGGGHAHSAGCTISRERTLEEIFDFLSTEILHESIIIS